MNHFSSSRLNRCFHVFVHNLLLTSPFIRIQFKTLKLVCVISSFYKVFLHFSSHLQFLNYSAKENPCCIYFLALWKSSSSILLSLFDTQIMNCLARHKSLSFILKESSKYQNINYRAKNHVVMFCFGLPSIARFNNTNASYFNTHRLESEGKLEKNKNVIHWPSSVHIGRKCTLGPSAALALRHRAVLKTLGTVSPNTDLPAGE